MPRPHAFDFDVGVWKTHSSRLMHPLTGSHDWADMDGVSVVSKVWNGRANLAEFEAQGPAGHVELLALRWYNPQSHQWNLDFATPSVGVLGIPGVGEFHDGRGEFYGQEMIGGRAVLGPVFDLGDHPGHRAIRTGVLHGRRQNLGNQLDQQVHPDEAVETRPAEFSALSSGSRR